MPLIPVSIGEIVDKLTILKIKKEQIQEPTKVAVVQRQYQNIFDCLRDPSKTEKRFRIQEDDFETNVYFLELYQINRRLWDCENLIRSLVRQQDFGSEFIQVSKDIRAWNDERAHIKKKIDQRFGSDFWDVKDHTLFSRDRAEGP